ncbi:MAG: hypothetical protein II039_08870, partial [Treponema sp.]|nr:hypothetical protein [Treponema sp.]
MILPLFALLGQGKGYVVVEDKCKCGETLVGEDCYFNVTSVGEMINRITSRGSASKLIIKQNINLGTYTDDPILNFEGKLNGNNKRITGIINQKAYVYNNA